MTSTRQAQAQRPRLFHPAQLLIVSVTIACWVYVLTGAGTGMDVWSMSTLEFPPPARLSPMNDATMHGSTLSMVGMWWSMMLAMMLPGALGHFPNAHQQTTAGFSLRLGFGLGYAAVWLLFSVAAAYLQLILVRAGLLDGMKLWSASDLFSALLLAIAGLFQFTGFKIRRLHNCRCAPTGPPDCFSGLHYGLNCLSSSAPLMLLLFVGGVMNAYWIVLLTLIITIEKTATAPARYRRAAGLACLAAAAAVLIT